MSEVLPRSYQERAPNPEMALVAIEAAKAFTIILSNVPLLCYLMVAFRRQIFPLRPFFLRNVQRHIPDSQYFHGLGIVAWL